jgi:hypothetical protein
MKAHFPTVDEACRAVEPTLRAWEVDADLRWGRDELRFTFDGANVIDRAPAPPGVIHVSAFVVGAALVSAIGTVSVHVTRANYPAPPPATFRLNPDGESILARYQGYLDGREPLPSMAYFCLTVVECKVGKAGGRKRAAAAYRIDLSVLNKMGELTSERGDTLNARKAAAAQPLTGAEHAWPEEAVKMLIRRLGDTRNAAALPMITMSDLPSL